MCENLLKSVLNGNIETELILKWLKNEKIEEEQDVLSSIQCDQGDFVLFFLNYLHDETAGVLQSCSSEMTPNRIRTPRRIDNFVSKPPPHIDSKKSTTRRVSLFPEKENQSQYESLLGVSNLDTGQNISFNDASSQFASTPRSLKFQTSLDSEIALKESLNHMSPIPVYKNKSYSELKSRSFTPKSSSRPENSSICLGDFIVQKKSSANKQKKQKQLNVSSNSNDSLNQSCVKPNLENCLNLSNIEKSDDSFNNSKNKYNHLKVSKRINPTSLTSTDGVTNSKRIIPQDSRNSFSFQKLSDNEVSVENSRHILQEERLKILNRPKIIEKAITPELILSTRTRSMSICNHVQPKVELVTFKAQLNTLAQIYSLLIDLNLALNTLSELYFLITLVLMQANTEQNEKEIGELRTALKDSLTGLETNEENITGLFKSIHNCVYFGAIVLNSQRHILSTLDRASLKLLQENSRLQIFAPELTKQLMRFYNEKVTNRTAIFKTNVGENVSFISDTDNRENFPTDSSFHTFRKQRDLFYEFMRTWESNHLQPNWNFTLNLGVKIRNLISMHSDPANISHLARLFKNQLITECSQNTDSEPLPSCLNALANLNAEKLSRLRSRLVSRKSTGGPSPEPSFPGRQEFYKEFIIVCDSAKFHRHLIDSLSDEILQLDDTSYWLSETDETGAAFASGVKELFLNSLKALKTLAKFLGLLESLPYKSDLVPNHQILTTQFAIRKQYMPSIDVVTCLNRAIQIGKLMLTIPWLADYVAMFDHITLRLPYFSKLIETLFEIHQNLEGYLKLCAGLEEVLMIRLSLGWLFERPNFPLESYQHWISKKYQVTNSTTNELVIKNRDYVNTNGDVSLDSLNLVDENVLFTCCPYLIEIRNFLSSDPNSNYNKSGPVKYIRPVSTVVDNCNVSNKRMQKQLEDAFFHSQPSSTKKTIDLITERVASACVKYICHNLVPEAKKHSVERFINHLEHLSLSTLNYAALKEQLQTCCLKYAKDLSDESFETFKNVSNKDISTFTEVRCEDSLKALLADDVHPVTRTTCVSITVEQCSEKIQQWFSSHVNPGIFLKEFITEMDNAKQSASQNSKKITYKLPSKGKNVEHDPNSSSPVSLLIKIRDQMLQIQEHPEIVTIEFLHSLIQEASSTCDNRCDLNPVAQFMACRLFYDMLFMLATHRPDIATDASLLESLLQFWSKYVDKSERASFFDRILCVRNATMFEMSSAPDKTWLACEKLLIEVLKNKLLKLENFEKQTIAMFRYEWSSSMIKYFTKCLQNVLDDYVRRNGSQENFTFILSWLADYCNDDDFF